jgi:hypothetical protein
MNRAFFTHYTIFTAKINHFFGNPKLLSYPLSFQLSSSSMSKFCRYKKGTLDLQRRNLNQARAINQMRCTVGAVHFSAFSDFVITFTAWLKLGAAITIS